MLLADQELVLFACQALFARYFWDVKVFIAKRLRPSKGHLFIGLEKRASLLAVQSPPGGVVGVDLKGCPKRVKRC